MSCQGQDDRIAIAPDFVGLNPHPDNSLIPLASTLLIVLIVKLGSLWATDSPSYCLLGQAFGFQQKYEMVGHLLQNLLSSKLTHDPWDEPAIAGRPLCVAESHLRLIVRGWGSVCS